MTFDRHALLFEIHNCIYLPQLYQKNGHNFLEISVYSKAINNNYPINLFYLPSFIVLPFIFKSTMHIELIFLLIYAVR